MLWPALRTNARCTWTLASLGGEPGLLTSVQPIPASPRPPRAARRLSQARRRARPAYDAGVQGERSTGVMSHNPHTTPIVTGPHSKQSSMCCSDCSAAGCKSWGFALRALPPPRGGCNAEGRQFAGTVTVTLQRKARREGDSAPKKSEPQLGSFPGTYFFLCP